MARSAAPSRKPSPNPLYVVLGVVALAAIAFFIYRGAAGSGNAATRPVEGVILTQAELNRVKGISQGSENAPVVIWEFADFQCPGCGSFATFVSPLIKERLVETGQARFVFYDFPLAMHPHAFLAARAGRCANEQGKFWPYHDVLFGQQPNWSASRNPADLFVGYAEQAGLDRGKFEECLYSDRYAREVTESMQLGQSLGVEGTPTLFVNGKRLPEIPSFTELQEIVRREAGGAAAPAPAADTARADSAAP